MSRISALFMAAAMTFGGCTDGDPNTTLEPDLPTDEDLGLSGNVPPTALPNPPPHPPLAVLLATHQAQARDLFVANDTLYWIDDGELGPVVNAVSTAGGAWGTLEFLDESPMATVYTSDTLFVANAAARNIERVDLTDGKRDVFLALSGVPLALVLSDDTIFVATDEGRVTGIPLDGSPAVPVAKVDGTIVGFQVGDKEIFIATAEGALYRGGTSGGGVEKVELATVTGRMILDATDLYWEDASQRAVMRLSRSFGGPRLFLSHQYEISGMSADRTFVYVTTLANNALTRMEKALDALAPETLSNSLRSPTEVMVDDQIYFVQQDIHAIAILR